jgi:predicted small secreted protein
VNKIDMKKLIILLFLFSCTTNTTTDDKPKNTMDGIKKVFERIVIPTP